MLNSLYEIVLTILFRTIGMKLTFSPIIQHTFPFHKLNYFILYIYNILFKIGNNSKKSILKFHGYANIDLYIRNIDNIKINNIRK